MASYHPFYYVTANVVFTHAPGSLMLDQTLISLHIHTIHATPSTVISAITNSM